MSKAEQESQSFLFRIWREDPEEVDPPLNFRGHMTCLLDGTRVYVQSWIEVQAFINSYLEASGTSGGPTEKLNWAGESPSSRGV